MHGRTDHGRMNVRLWFPRIERLAANSEKVQVVEGRSDYGGGLVSHVANVVEFRDGKIWRETRYYAQPFEAPAWRAQWVERLEEPGARRVHALGVRRRTRPCSSSTGWVSRPSVDYGCDWPGAHR